LELYKNSNEINKYSYYSHFLKRKTKTAAQAASPLSLWLGPTARLARMLAPARSRLRPRGLATRAAQ
jgi:hypothetical protein